MACAVVWKALISMAKHNWQTTERMCIYCGTVQRRDISACPACGGQAVWSASDVLLLASQMLLRLIGYAVVVPVLVYLIGTMSPVQIVVEYIPTQMRAGGACFVPMPREAVLIRIAAACPIVHVPMRYPAETRQVVLAFDAFRREPWARGIDAFFLTLFALIEGSVSWVVTFLTPAAP